MYGIGLPTATRFRAYQNPPVAIIGSVQARKARTRSPRRAIATIPMVRTAAGGRNESLTPAAMPMARPAPPSAARGVVLAVREGDAGVIGALGRLSDRMRPKSAPRLAYAFTSSATAHSGNAPPVMSLSASPAWNSTSIWAPRATEAPVIACGPRPYGRP